MIGLKTFVVIVCMMMMLMQAQLESGADLLRLKLALAQLYLYQEHIYQACDVLRSLTDLSYSPGIVRYHRSSLLSFICMLLWIAEVV